MIVESSSIAPSTKFSLTRPSQKPTAEVVGSVPVGSSQNILFYVMASSSGWLIKVVHGVVPLLACSETLELSCFLILFS